MNLNHAEIMKSLPLVAAVLGKKYSVSVEFGHSNTAYTNGRVVYIPDIEQSEEGVRLARGYIDHEAGGHLRFTDFSEWKNARLNKTENFICNAIEDWRVEHKLCEIYSGCRENLDWLSMRFFAQEKTKNSGDGVRDCLNYILLSIRSWDTPAVAAANGITLNLDLKFAIDSILDEVRSRCSSTSDAVGYAKQLGSILEKEVQKQGREAESPLDSSGDNSGPQQGAGSSQDDAVGEADAGSGRGCGGEAESQEGGGRASDENVRQLQNLGELMQDALGAMARQAEKGTQSRLVPAKVIDGSVFGTREEYMTADERKDALAESAKLRRRLQALLMSRVARRVNVGSSGRKLSGRHLSRIAVDSSRVFSREDKAEGYDVHVELLLDCSSSMAGSAIKLALNACYAVAHALLDIQGIHVDIDAFPCSYEATVMPVRFTRNRWMKLEAIGTTPLGQALVCYFQKAVVLKQKRKICIIITDGSPDDMNSARRGVDIIRMIGSDVYGIGIQYSLINDIAGESHCFKVTNMKNLSYYLTKILRDYL